MMPAALIIQSMWIIAYLHTGNGAFRWGVLIVTAAIIAMWLTDRSNIKKTLDRLIKLNKELEASREGK